MKKNNFIIGLSLSFVALALLAGCGGKKKSEPTPTPSSSIPVQSEFTVEWKNYDGTLLQRDVAVPKGTVPEYTGNKPVRYDDETHYYVFNGWDKEVKEVTANVTYTATFTQNDKVALEEEPDNYADALPSETKDGFILHAFNWTFKQIEHNLPYISNAGYKSVQTMPLQTPKSNGSSWWAFYQPLSFSIAEESSLGTKADFIHMCEVAETYNISIIVDVVFNHMANVNDEVLEEDGTPVVSPLVEEYEPEIYAHRNDEVNPTFHHNKNATGSGKETQYYQYGDLPDLNTGNELVQQRALSFLKECIDAGADGFRFDAAKHIETSKDSDYPSSFWENTLGVAKQYYLEKTGRELYAYGEVLGSPSGRSLDVYTELMNITDDNYCTNIINGASRRIASVALNAIHKTEPTKLVSWLESHDTYVGSKNPWSNVFMSRSWAMLGSRQYNAGLYLARPDDTANPSVGVVGDYFFKDESLGVVNRFHNRFLDGNEVTSADGSIFVCEREKDNAKGAVVVDLFATSKIVVDFSTLGSGIYYDQLTGKKVEVRNGHATIELHKSGISVLTKSNNMPRPSFEISERGGAFVKEKSVKVTLTNASEGIYQINNQEPVSFTKSATIILEDTDAVEGNINLNIIAKNDQFEVQEDFSFYPIELIEGYFNVVNLKQDYIDNYELYLWSWGGTYGNGTWNQDYEIRGNTMLVDVDTSGVTGFIVGLFKKDYVITELYTWDFNVLKQTVNIANSILEQGYFDASEF